ncbi:MAG: GtrA family protein [archaeon]|nr:GtrA family protein [archaeon]
MHLNIRYFLRRAQNNCNTKLFSLYLVFAGIATFVDLGLLYYLTECLHVWYFYSAFLAYFAGMVIHFSLNKYLNFKNRSKKVIRQFGLFALVALVGLVLNQIIVFSLVEFLNLWYMYAKFIVVFIIMFWNFYGHKKVTFSVFT